MGHAIGKGEITAGPKGDGRGQAGERAENGAGKEAEMCSCAILFATSVTSL